MTITELAILHRSVAFLTNCAIYKTGKGKPPSGKNTSYTPDQGKRSNWQPPPTGGGGGSTSFKKEPGRNTSSSDAPLTVPEAIRLLNLDEGFSTRQHVLKAFRKMSVSCHPDKTGGDSRAFSRAQDSLLFHTPILSRFISNQYYTYPL